MAERYADRAEVAACAATMLPTLGAFTRAYDKVRQSDVPWTHSSANGRQAVYELVVIARIWLPLVVRDVAGVDRSNYLDSVISDDLVEDVDQLIALLRDSRGAGGEVLTYRDDAIGDLDRVLRAAQLKWSEAEASDLAYAKRMHDLRRRAVDFRAELEWFSHSVAFALDHASPDYLRLLLSRAWQLDSADDRLSPQPEIVEPATLVTGIPRSLEA